MLIQIVQAGNTEISARNPGINFHIRAVHPSTVQLYTRDESAHYAHSRDKPQLIFEDWSAGRMKLESIQADAFGLGSIGSGYRIGFNVRISVWF